MRHGETKTNWQHERGTHRLNTLGDEEQLQTIREEQTINKVEHTQGSEESETRGEMSKQSQHRTEE